MSVARNGQNHTKKLKRSQRTEHWERDMNPTLTEDIMRQRAHSSAIMLATLLTCLFVATNRASAADGITVIVPLNVTNLHEDIEKVYTRVSFFHLNAAGSQRVGMGQTFMTVVDRSAVEQDNEVHVISLDQNFLNAETYSIELLLWISGATQACNPDYEYASDHVCGDEKFTMKTYAPVEGPISDLIPE